MTARLAEAWFRRLPAEEAAVCRAVYLDGLGVVETAGRLGCAPAEVSRRLRQAVARFNAAPRYR